MPASPERDALEREPGLNGPGHGGERLRPDALRTAGLLAGADLEARIARQRVADALFGPEPMGPGLERGGARELPGRIGGRYELERPLGAGGMGVVYAAWDPELQRRVAIKVIHEELELAATRARVLGSASEQAAEGSQVARAAKAQARMLREARALARLSHPNVIHVYDVGTHEGRLFVAMEMVDGQTLRRWLEGAGHDPRRVMDHLLAAGRGLEAAHRSGLVHRDFKPENVLIGADGRVRVVDFGLARLLEPVDTVETAAPDPGAEHEPVAESDLASTRASNRPPANEARTAGSVARADGAEHLTLAGVLVGTPRYMAPEQLDGLPADAASDQFAFCVVAWEALTGRPPFAATTVEGLRTAIRARTFDTSSAAGSRATRTPALRAALTLLERGLHHDPSRRWASMTELLAGLSLALARPKPRRKASKRSIALAMLVGALGAVAIAALVVPLGVEPGQASRSVSASAGRIVESAREVPATRPSGKVRPSVAVTGATPSGGGVAATGDHAGAGVLGTAGGPPAEPAPAAPSSTAASLPSASAGQGRGEPEPAARDVCHLHEDSYELLERGSRQRALRHADGCFECRIERRRSRTSRFSPAGCGAYALCAPQADDACP